MCLEAELVMICATVDSFLTLTFGGNLYIHPNGTGVTLGLLRILKDRGPLHLACHMRGRFCWLESTAMASWDARGRNACLRPRGWHDKTPCSLLAVRFHLPVWSAGFVRQ